MDSSLPKPPEPQSWAAPAVSAGGSAAAADPEVKDSFCVVEDDEDDESESNGADMVNVPPPGWRGRPVQPIRRRRHSSSSYRSYRSSSSSSSDEDDDESIASAVEMGPIININDTEEIKAMSPRLLKLDDVFDSEEHCRVILPYDEKRFAPEDRKEAIVSIEKTEGCVLVLRRVFFREGIVNKTVLDIRSPLIRNVLKQCILEDRASLETSSTMPWPNDLVFRYRDHIKAAAAEQGPLTVSHVGVLLNLVETDFAFPISEINAKFPKGAATFAILREAFLPGEIVVSGRGDSVRGYRVTSAKYVWETESGRAHRVQRLKIGVEYVLCDGRGFGTTARHLTIDEFQGVKYLTQLYLCPLRVHPNADAVREKLLARGRTYSTLKGQNFRHVKGDVLTVHNAKKTTVNSRVVIDLESYERLDNSPRAIVSPMMSPILRHASKRRRLHEVTSLLPNNLSPLKEPLAIGPSGKELVGEDLLISNDSVHVFSLKDKQFFVAQVDMIQDIAFNKELFDQLVIDPRTKNLARIMVERHIKGSTFDDFVEGKGKGLVMLLHGPPGVGKTMMAEAIAEHTQRPLYAISSGELGANPPEMERKLTRILDIAHCYKAVLLLDEADVFLERRNTQSLNRNALVSIFLRMLEYYPGILILTSNRAETFDEAFHSRIHLTFAFSSLDYQSRERVWRNFAAQCKEGVALTETDLKELSKHPLNGRQIKNTFSAAAELAADCGERIAVHHVQNVLMVLLTSPLLRLKQGVI